MPRAHAVERAESILQESLKTITMGKMTWSTITEIIFRRLCTVIKSGEVIKNPFWRQQLLPSLIFVPYSKSIPTLLPSPTLNHSFSGESHLWCSLFLGKHWKNPRCLTPAMCVNPFMLHQWGLLAGFLVHCHACEPQETGAQSGDYCFHYLQSPVKDLASNSFSLGWLIFGLRHAHRNYI